MPEDSDWLCPACHAKVRCPPTSLQKHILYFNAFAFCSLEKDLAFRFPDSRGTNLQSLQDEVLDMISESFDFRYELETPADAVFQTIGTLQRKTSNSAAKDSIGKRGSGTWSSWFLLNSEELVSSDTDDESFR